MAVTDIEAGPFWRKDDPGGTVISQFSGYDNATGRIELNVALAGADPPGGSGSGVLAILHLRAKREGTVRLTFGQDVRFRDSTGRDIPLNAAIEPEIVIHGF